MKNDGSEISRRILLGSAATLLAGGAAALSRSAAAQEKISKADAKYQDHPNYNGAQRCEICLQFNPPNHCKIVDGEISPKGWCQYFAAKENAR